LRRAATVHGPQPHSRLIKLFEEPKMTEARNVFGEPLAECCTKPMTGFYRDGSCNTGPEDFGMHTVCTRVDAAFLAFSQAAGNDLSTPVPDDRDLPGALFEPPVY
jgi:uncharacterized protein (DUF2237 family)